MKLSATLACLAAVALSSGAMAQTAAQSTTTARPPTGTSATSNSGTVAKGGVDTSPAAGNAVVSPKSSAAAAAPTAPTAAAPAADQFKDEASAKGHCPSDAIVWVNLNSKAYHAAGTKYYGKTKNGAYECQKDADSDGFHAAGHKKTAAAAPAK
jgi:hypothetical protein